MAGGGRDFEERRRRLFRRMEWFFVYLPPILAVVLTVGVSAFLAWAVHIPDTSYWERFGMGVGLILGLPLVAYVAKSWWENRN